MKMSLTNVGGHCPNHWGLNKTKRQRKGEFALSATAEMFIFSFLQILVVLDFWTQTGTYAIFSLILRLLDLDGITFPTLPVMGQAGLYNQVSQFLK